MDGWSPQSQLPHLLSALMQVWAGGSGPICARLARAAGRSALRLWRSTWPSELGSVAMVVARPAAQTPALRNRHRPSAPDAARPATAGPGAQAERAETPTPSAMTADEREQQRWLDLVEGRGWRG
jgi:hypothetical protein